MNMMAKNNCLLLLISIASAVIAMTSDPRPWSEYAQSDIAAIEKTLQENHPGTLDMQSRLFQSWIKNSKKQLPEKLTHVTDEYSYRTLLSWYAKGFNDGHLSLEFPSTEMLHQTFEWPGFLMTYDPERKDFLLDKNLDYLWPANGHRWRYNNVIKIDGISPQEWLSENVIPYRFGGILGLESAFVKTAPWALIWTNNPFVKKPTTITVGAMMSCRCMRGGEHSTKTVTLNWTPSNPKELDEKISTLRGFVKDKHARIVFFNKAAKTTHPHDIYVKLPSFSGENSGISNSLNHVTEQIKKYVTQKRKQTHNLGPMENLPLVNIVFDLRGNGGGSSSFGTKLLENLYGKPYTDQEIFNATSKEVVWWRATPANIAWLKDNPYIAHASPEAKKWLANMAENLQKTLNTKEPFFKESCNQIRTCIYACPHVKAKISIIIDTSCASAALDFIDEAKACGKDNVTLIGQPTSADSVYMELCQANIPSAAGKTLKLFYPMKVYRNRLRGHNQPYAPNFFLHVETIKKHPTTPREIANFLKEIEEQKSYATDFITSPAPEAATI